MGNAIAEQLGFGSVRARSARGYTDPMQDEVAAPGIARAGAAFADRRQELGLSQRELAKKGLITASSLIAFEKGRSWPRERTRAMLEEVVQWPAGTLAGIRAGNEIPGSTTGPNVEEADAPLIVAAVDVALSTVNAATANLPAADHPKF